MVETQKSKNIPYFLGMGAASVSGFVAAYLVSHNMSGGEYDAATIAVATGIAKEATFFTSNLVYHSCFKRKQYKDEREWKHDMKSLSKSNIGGMAVSTVIKASCHYGLMKYGINPEASMWAVYVPAGWAGGITKFFIDSKNKMFEVPDSLKSKWNSLKNKFNKKKKLEELL